jgi:hypothetical protein
MLNRFSWFCGYLNRKGLSAKGFFMKDLDVRNYNCILIKSFTKKNMKTYFFLVKLNLCKNYERIIKKISQPQT